MAADHRPSPTTSRIGYGGLEKRLDLPKTGPSACPSVYSFTYGNVGIISLDANELSWEIQGLLDYSNGAQARWLEDRLAAWRRDRRIDFIVAFFHECAFSTCNGHSSDGGVRSTLAPLFSRYQVDLADPGPQPRLRADQPARLRRRRPTAPGRASRPSPSRPDEPAEVEPANGRHHLCGGGHRGHAALRLDGHGRD